MSSQALILETNGWASKEVKIALKLMGFGINHLEWSENNFCESRDLPIGIILTKDTKSLLYYYTGSGIHNYILKRNIQPYTKLCDFIKAINDDRK